MVWYADLAAIHRLIKKLKLLIGHIKNISVRQGRQQETEKQKTIFYLVYVCDPLMSDLLMSGGEAYQERI